MEEHAPKNECFFHPFCDIYYHPCHLNLLTTPLGWEIMNYESEPLPY